MDELAGAGVTLVPIEAGMKTCTKCGENKPMNEFHRDRTAVGGYRSSCKACRSAQMSDYYDRTASRKKAYEKQRRRRHGDRIRATERQRYAASPERKKAQAMRWYNDNLEHARALKRANPNAKMHHHKRRARHACAVPQRWQIHDVLPFCCYWCGSNLRAYGATSHVDHVMPISLGGPAVPSNEVMTCATCNLRKSAKHPLVWIAELTA